MPTSLYGRWILDSTSGRDGKIISGGPRGHTEFTLLPDNTFNYQWSDFDVMGEHSGTYNYNNTVDKRSHILIFSTYSSQKKDSIVSRDTMIIIQHTDSILKTQEKESYTTLDSILIIQNRINVYRKNLKR